jgi:ferric-dicitrate binding protein FerR (iron transport regulator)
MTTFGFDIEKLNRYFKGEYSDKDASYVDQVFCDNNKEKELKSLLSRQFDELLHEDDVDIKNLDHILYRIHYDINTRLSARNRWSFDNIIKWTLRIAVVIILPLAILAGIHLYNESHLQKKEAWVEIKAPAWTRAQFSLPDGTTGWLNGNSSLKYSGNFNSDRQVTLSGEAFFDVFKDTKRPFIVKTNEVSASVLGTRFNIASYENENKVELVLEEGKLVLNDKELKKSYTMKPNDLVIYDKSLKDFSNEVVQPQKYTSWTEGKLVFRNDPLDVVARRLERWYNIDVELNASSTEDFRWRATFVDVSLEEVLNLLKRSLPINYRIEKRDLKPDETFTRKKVIITLGTK